MNCNPCGGRSELQTAHYKLGQDLVKLKLDLESIQCPMTAQQRRTLREIHCAATNIANAVDNHRNSCCDEDPSCTLQQIHNLRRRVYHLRNDVFRSNVFGDCCGAEGECAEECGDMALRVELDRVNEQIYCLSQKKACLQPECPPNPCYRTPCGPTPCGGPCGQVRASYPARTDSMNYGSHGPARRSSYTGSYGSGSYPSTDYYGSRRTSGSYYPQSRLNSELKHVLHRLERRPRSEFENQEHGGHAGYDHGH